MNSPSQKKARTVLSPVKVMSTVFWDAEGWVLADFSDLEETISASRHVQAVHNLRQVSRDKRPGRRIILQHHNVPPHSARCASDEIEKLGWEILSRLSYSPDLHLQTIRCSDLLWIGCEANYLRQWRRSRQQFVTLSRMLEWSSATWVSSNLQNSGKSVCKTVGIFGIAFQ